MTRHVGSALLLFSLLVACEAAPTPGAPCSFASECPRPLTCSYGRCRVECRETRDCPVAARCIASSGAGVCTIEVENHCDSDVCPSPLVCIDDQCRTRCSDNPDCFAGVCSEGTCIEPLSGLDAAIPLVDATPDAGAPGVCEASNEAASAGLLELLLGSRYAAGSHSMFVATEPLTETDAARPAALAIAAMDRGAGLVYVGTIASDVPRIFRASVDDSGEFVAYDAFDDVDDSWSLDLRASADGLLAVVGRQPMNPGDAFAWAHDDADGMDATVHALTPNRTLLPSETFRGRVAITGGSAGFAGAATGDVHYVFHTEAPSTGGEIGATTRGRSGDAYRATESGASFASSFLEAATSVAPLYVFRDPATGHVAYWRTDVVVSGQEGLDAVELRAVSSALPGVATAFDGTETLLAWTSGTAIEIETLTCEASSCEPQPIGSVADGTSQVERVALTTIASGYVLAVARADGTVSLGHLSRDGSVSYAPFPSLPGAAGGVLRAPEPFAGTSHVAELRLAASETPAGAVIAIAVVDEDENARRVWTARYVACAL